MLSKLGLFDDLNGSLNFQDAAFKVVLPTKKAGLFSFFGMGGISNFLLKDISPALWQTPGNRFVRNKTSEDYKKGSHLLNLGMNHTLTLNRKSHINTALAFSSEGIKDEVFENFLYKLYDNTGNYKKDSIVNNVLNFNGRLTKSTYRGRDYL